jgi:hypothetical protein
MNDETPGEDDDLAPVEEEDDRMAEYHARRAAYRAHLRRQREGYARFLTELFGAEDQFDRQAPQPLQDMASQLGEHAAQLRNAARFLMARVTLDDQDSQDSTRAATAIANIARTNIAIAKALREEAEANQKTVHGVAIPVEPQG